MLTLLKTYDAFLALVRFGIGHETNGIPYSVNWPEIKAFAETHGLSAVVLDGLNEVRNKRSDVKSDWFPAQTMTLQWVGEVWRDYEQRYESYKKAISELAGFYNAHDYKMMVLKGYACSQDWPKPEHRPCGDIDIWQFGRQKDADDTLAKEKSINMDNSHHHHSVFQWNGFDVENHYDFINVHHHKSNVAYEAILKELGLDDSHYVNVNGERVYLPSPNLHALFLLKHLMMHFASEGIVLRQVLDWGFFVKKHRMEVDWNMVLDVLERFGMRKMFNIINAICVGDLGFAAKLFPEVQFDPYLKDRVIKEILEPQYSVSLPQNAISRVVFKIRRWKSNAWKHELCYKESLWSAFWSGVWNHLLKPKSI